MLHMRMSFGVIRYYKWWTAGYAKIAKNGYMNFDNNTWKREKGRRKRERERCDGAHHLKRQAIGDVSGSGVFSRRSKVFLASVGRKIGVFVCACRCRSRRTKARLDF